MAELDDSDRVRDPVIKTFTQPASRAALVQRITTADRNKMQELFAGRDRPENWQSVRRLNRSHVLHWMYVDTST